MPPENSVKHFLLNPEAGKRAIAGHYGRFKSLLAHVYTKVILLKKVIKQTYQLIICL